MNDQPNQPKNPTKQVFDVLPPGKSAPSPTSRPIIVGNKPEQTDPMVTQPPLPPEPETEKPAETPPAEQPEPEKISVHVETAPTPEPKPAQTLAENKPGFVVAHHSKPAAKKRNLIILIIVLIILAIVIADLLLDAQIIKSSLPHTHFLKTSY